MIKFTKEEINLCKQVAEKHRKEIDREDYAYDEEEQEKVLINDCNAWVEEKKTELYRLKDDGTNLGYKVKHWFPLWTISDCLEFLRGKSGSSLGDPNYGSLHLSFSVDIDTTITKILLGTASVNDLNIACLKAMLAVLEEGK